MNQADVIVVGAGAAGLSAARELTRRGVRVAVLEAGSRAGGRILTEHPAGWQRAVELGAEFIHGEQPELNALVSDAGLALEPVEALHFSLRQGQLAAASEFYDVEELIDRAKDVGSKKSVLDFLSDVQVHPALSQWVTHFVEGFHAAPPERVSARSLAEQGAPQEDQFRVQQGYGALVDYLERDASSHGARIEYLEPVHEIRVQPGGVEVHAFENVWHGSAVIVAVPLSIFGNDAFGGGIRFEPMPDWLGPLTKSIEMGTAQRLVIRLKDPLALHHELPGGAFFHVLGAAVPTFWLTGDDAEPQITAWCGGPTASTWAHSGDPLAVALESLASGLGKSVDELRPLVLDAHAHDFGRDPRARGAYPYRLAHRDQPAAEEIAGRPPLLVAGDFLEGSSLGTVGAAVRSGFDAARTVLSLG